MAFKRLFADFADKNHSDLWAELNRRIDQAFSSSAGKVSASGSDTTPDYLLAKLVAGSNVSLTLLNAGADEQIRIDASGGAGGAGGCSTMSEWTTVVQAKVAALPFLVADSVLTSTAPGALQSAIDALGSGQVLEVRTDATYDPITLPAVVGGYTVKAGEGFQPKITGQECVKLANGAQDVTFSGFELYDGTSPVANSRGAFVSFASEFALVERIIFVDLYVHDVIGVAPGVMLSYFWAAYANPPNPATQMSSKLAFVDCEFINAGDWEIEGASLNVRGFDQTYISRCSLDGGGKTTRAVQLQNCFNTIIEDSVAFNVSAGNGGEGFKLDQLGAWEATYGAWSTGIIRRCTARDVAQGFDIDDYVAAYVHDCTAHDCAEEGFDLDNDSYALFECCTAYGNVDGFRFEPGCKGTLRGCAAYDNSSNDYRMDNGYQPDLTNQPRQTPQGGSGGRARVSLTDNTEDFLASKLVAGPGIALATLNAGASEQLQISATSSGGAILTAEGGIAVPLINDTGAPSVKGQLVRTSLSVDGGFVTSNVVAGPPVGQYEVIGAVYEANIPNGSPCYVVIYGIADVLMQDGQAATRGYWVRGSTTVNGRAIMSAAPPVGSSDNHFQEVGHSNQTVPAGVNVLARIVMHLN